MWCRFVHKKSLKPLLKPGFPYTLPICMYVWQVENWQRLSCSQKQVSNVGIKDFYIFVGKGVLG